MTTAFIIGITVFQEVLSNILLGSFAIPTLVLGVVSILSCQQIERSTNITTTTPSKGNAFTALEGGDDDEKEEEEEEEEEETVYLSSEVFPREFSGIEREKYTELETTNKKEKTYCDDNVSTTGKNKDSDFIIIEDKSNGVINESVMLTPNETGESNSFYYDRKSKQFHDFVKFIFEYALSFIFTGTNLLGNQFLKFIQIAKRNDVFFTTKAVGLCIIAGVISIDSILYISCSNH